jgi:hypothetical protein
MRRYPVIRTPGLRIDVKPTQVRFRALPEFSGLSKAGNKGLSNSGNHTTLTHVSHRSDQIRVARRSCAHVAAVCSGVLTLVSIFVGVKLPVATSWPAVEPTAVPALQTVNRTGKGDHFPLRPVTGADTGSHRLEDYVKRTPLPADRLMDGCESPVSALDYSPLTQIAGRCVS